MISKKVVYSSIGICASLLLLSVWFIGLNHKNQGHFQPDVIEIGDFEPTTPRLGLNAVEASKKSSQNVLTNAPSASAQDRETIRHSKHYDDEWCLQKEVIPLELLDASLEILRFYEERGYEEVTRKDTSYLSYDIFTLEALSKQGDQRAMVNLYFKPDAPAELKKWAANQSLVYGDTILALDLSKDLVSKALQNRSKDSAPGESRQLFLDGIVVAVFAGRRDPLNLLAGVLASIFNNPEIDIDAGEFRLSESDFSKILYRAQLFQEDLDRKRIQLGLPPLDNTVPKIVQNMKNREMAALFTNYDVPHWLEKVIPHQDCVKAMRFDFD